jgi:hypothetical protein
MAFALAFSLSAVTTASAYHTRFVQNTCWFAPPVFMGNGMTRYAALAYAYHGRFEGYQWGGGCWNDNNIDDSPGDPVGDIHTGGEGGDCSGYVFKSWFESLDGTDGRFWWWHIGKVLHGPYDTNAFIRGDGAANAPQAKNLLIPMDALASSTHMAMLFVPNGDGTDDVMEAKGEAYGTGIWTRDYRGLPKFKGVRRVGWSG